MQKPPKHRKASLAALLAGLGGAIGCDAVVFERRAPLFYTPLTVDGESVGDAIVDTGGGYEIILRESFGLKVTDTVEVLAFGGKEFVAVTEPFRYQVDEFHGTADFALVGLSICECNGVGFHFLRRNGMRLRLDYPTMQAEFVPGALSDFNGITTPFDPPPPELSGFDTAFVEVLVESGGTSRPMLALLDTGSNGTIVRKELFPADATLPADRQDVRITRAEWGTVAVRAVLFDTPGLPDLIIGTDVMAAWSDRWEFTFTTPGGGEVAVFPRSEYSAESASGPIPY